MENHQTQKATESLTGIRNTSEKKTHSIGQGEIEEKKKIYQNSMIL